jgi:hypothetical protein
VSADRETTDRCVERSSFERLSGGRRPGDEDSSSHYRKGIAGDWRSVLDETALGHFESIAGGLARELGYPDRQRAAAG